MSSVTSICPSQNEDEPIPIVGIFNLLVINFADAGDRHSKIIENAPDFSINFASLRSFVVSNFVLPSIANFF